MRDHVLGTLSGKDGYDLKARTLFDGKPRSATLSMEEYFNVRDATQERLFYLRFINNRNIAIFRRGLHGLSRHTQYASFRRHLHCSRDVCRRQAMRQRFRLEAKQ